MAGVGDATAVSGLAARRAGASVGGAGRRAALAARPGSPRGLGHGPSAGTPGAESRHGAAAAVRRHRRVTGLAQPSCSTQSATSTGRPRFGCGWRPTRWPEVRCARQTSCCKGPPRPVGEQRPQPLRRVELLTTAGRAAEALEAGAAALDVARGDEHALLCLGLGRAAVVVGRWSLADDYVALAGRGEEPAALILLADSAHGAGDIKRGDPACAGGREASSVGAAGGRSMRRAVLPGSDPPAERAAPGAGGVARRRSRSRASTVCRHGASRRSSASAPSSCWSSRTP